MSGTTCLGPCSFGASVVVYPEGVWYGRVTAKHVEEIVDRHIAGGKPVDRLLLSNIMTASQG